MTDKPAPPGLTDEERAKRKADGERRTLVMWGYVTGAITIISYIVKLEATFIPLGFGILGLVIAWQLNRKGERRNSVFAGALNLFGIMVWLTVNEAWLRGLLGG